MPKFSGFLFRILRGAPQNISREECRERERERERTQDADADGFFRCWDTSRLINYTNWITTQRSNVANDLLIIAASKRNNTAYNYTGQLTLINIFNQFVYHGNPLFAMAP